ncbi:hypothetical protein SMJ63A_80161 [Stenotrophomonas geniculata]
MYRNVSYGWGRDTALQPSAWLLLAMLQCIG